jgi:hypothetical protein
MWISLVVAIGTFDFTPPSHRDLLETGPALGQWKDAPYDSFDMRLVLSSRFEPSYTLIVNSAGNIHDSVGRNGTDVDRSSWRVPIILLESAVGFGARIVGALGGGFFGYCVGYLGASLFGASSDGVLQSGCVGQMVGETVGDILVPSVSTWSLGNLLGGENGSLKSTLCGAAIGELCAFTICYSFSQPFFFHDPLRLEPPGRDYLLMPPRSICSVIGGVVGFNMSVSF